MNDCFQINLKQNHCEPEIFSYSFDKNLISILFSVFYGV